MVTIGPVSRLCEMAKISLSTENESQALAPATRAGTENARTWHNPGSVGRDQSGAVGDLRRGGVGRHDADLLEVGRLSVVQQPRAASGRGRLRVGRRLAAARDALHQPHDAGGGARAVSVAGGAGARDGGSAGGAGAVAGARARRPSTSCVGMASAAPSVVP